MAKAQRLEYDRIPGIYEPIERIIEYTVCDKCGSDDIACIENKPAPEFSGRVNGAFSIIIIGSFYGGVIIGLLTQSAVIFCGLGSIALLAVVLYGLLTYPFGRHSTYKCNQCGNEDIT